jgi:hypothetical protein
MEFLIEIDHDGRHDLATFDPTDCATFFPDDSEEMRDWIEARQGKKNIYVSVNEAREGTQQGKRLSENNIAAIRAIVSDIDIPKKGGPDGKHFQALKAKLLKDVVPKLAKWDYPPSFIVDSGGGVQLWWMFYEPVAPENADRVKGIGHTINARIKEEFPEFKPDNVTDLPRVMRLPGTINVPDAKKRNQGRSSALATVLGEYSPKQRYSLDDLATWAPPTFDRKSKSSGEKLPEVDMALVRSAGSYDELTIDLRKKFDDARERDSVLRDLWDGAETRVQKDGSRSGGAFALARRLQQAGKFTATTYGQVLWVWEHSGYKPDEITAYMIGRNWRNSADQAPSTAGFDKVEIDESKNPYSAKAESKVDGNKPAVSEEKEQGEPLFEMFYEAAAKALTESANPLVKGLLDRGALSTWYGPPKTGKTFILLWLACCVAAGIPFAGHKTRRGAVLYIAMEGTGGILKRLEALRLKHPELDLSTFAIMRRKIDLVHRRSDGIKMIVEACRQLAENTGLPVELVVIDTVARAMGGGNDSDPVEMGTLIDSFDQIRTVSGAHLAAIHHTSKANPHAARGFGGLLGALDSEFEIQKGSLTATNMREAEDGLAWSVVLDPVVLGEDQDGEPIITRVATITDRKEMQIALTAQEAEVLQVIQEEAGEQTFTTGQLQDWLKTARNLDLKLHRASQILAQLAKKSMIEKKQQGQYAIA